MDLKADGLHSTPNRPIGSDPRLVKCEVCGHPWSAHPAGCPRAELGPGEAAIESPEARRTRAEYIKREVI